MIKTYKERTGHERRTRHSQDSESVGKSGENGGKNGG